jgi:hypothetical protein
MPISHRSKTVPKIDIERVTAPVRRAAPHELGKWRPSMREHTLVTATISARSGTAAIEIDRGYVLAALLLATTGVLLGLYMGLAEDRRLLSVHVALMLSGFVTLAIYGFAFRLWPSMKKAALAPVQFATAMVGTFLLIGGTYFFATSGSLGLAAVGSILVIAAGIMMVWLFWSHVGDRNANGSNAG